MMLVNSSCICLYNYTFRFLSTFRSILTFVLHLMPKKSGDILDSLLVGMDRHRWSICTNAKTTGINTDGFSEKKNRFRNYLFDIVRVVFVHTCFEHIPKHSQQWPQSVKTGVTV